MKNKNLYLSEMSNFTPTEKNIAEFFIINTEDIDFSIKEISKKLFVSEASLSRFSKKCGFKGYREFIYHYKDNFLKKSAKVTNNTKSVLNAYQEILNTFYNLVDEKQILRIISLFYKSEKVLVCGRGSSGFVAREMKLRFMRIGINIDALYDSDIIRMQTVFQDSRNLALGISISGETRDVLYFLEQSHKKGAKTVLITSNDRADFSSFCDEVLLLPYLKYLNYGSVISPQYPILIMVDILYSYYVEQDRFSKEMLHDNTVIALWKNSEK